LKIELKKEKYNSFALNRTSRAQEREKQHLSSNSKKRRRAAVGGGGKND